MAKTLTRIDDAFALLHHLDIVKVRNTIEELETSLAGLLQFDQDVQTSGSSTDVLDGAAASTVNQDAGPRGDCHGGPGPHCDLDVLFVSCASASSTTSQQRVSSPSCRVGRASTTSQQRLSLLPCGVDHSSTTSAPLVPVMGGPGGSQHEERAECEWYSIGEKIEIVSSASQAHMSIPPNYAVIEIWPQPVWFERQAPVSLLPRVRCDGAEGPPHRDEARHGAPQRQIEGRQAADCVDSELDVGSAGSWQLVGSAQAQLVALLRVRQTAAPAGAQQQAGLVFQVSWPLASSPAHPVGLLAAPAPSEARLTIAYGDEHVFSRSLAGSTRSPGDHQGLVRRELAAAGASARPPVQGQDLARRPWPDCLRGPVLRRHSAARMGDQDAACADDARRCPGPWLPDFHVDEVCCPEVPAHSGWVHARAAWPRPADLREAHQGPRPQNEGHDAEGDSEAEYGAPAALESTEPSAGTDDQSLGSSVALERPRAASEPPLLGPHSEVFRISTSLGRDDASSVGASRQARWPSERSDFSELSDPGSEHPPEVSTADFVRCTSAPNSSGSLVG